MYRQVIEPLVVQTSFHGDCQISNGLCVGRMLLRLFCLVEHYKFCVVRRYHHEDFFVVA